MDTGELRVPRMVGVFAAGRIVNPRTARSQLIGGMTMGLSMALHEEGVMDGEFGDYANHDLAGYHIASCADVGSIEVECLDERDTRINPLGTKGIGEIGIVGTAAAVANAVYHATGVRVRDLPITLERAAGPGVTLPDDLPAQGDAARYPAERCRPLGASWPTHRPGIRVVARYRIPRRLHRRSRLVLSTNALSCSIETRRAVSSCPALPTSWQQTGSTPGRRKTQPLRAGSPSVGRPELSRTTTAATGPRHCPSGQV